jgi:hypothetical protein
MKLGWSLRRSALIAALLGIASGGDASATGRVDGNATTTRVREVMVSMAECLLSHDRDVARQWFRTLPGSKEERKLMVERGGDLSICFPPDQDIEGKALKFAPPAMRRLLAFAVVRRLLAKAPATSPAAADSQPWFVPQLEKLGSPAHVDDATLTLMDFGHCVSVHEWSGALGLLAAREASPEEGVALARLRPVLGPCLPANAEITFTATNLRQMIAEPVYHLLKGDVAPAGAAA